MHFRIGPWAVTGNLGALAPITTLKRRKLGYGQRGCHLVWWRLSILIENRKDEVFPVCAECGSPDIGEVSAGDEGWTVCQSCQTIEGGYQYISADEYENVY